MTYGGASPKAKSRAAAQQRVIADKQTVACRNLLKGNCRFGSTCVFSHVRDVSATAITYSEDEYWRVRNDASKYAEELCVLSEERDDLLEELNEYKFLRMTYNNLVYQNQIDKTA